MTFICADDYGLTKFSDKHIAECADVGALNKISIFPNCEYEELKKMADRRDIDLSIHLNLVEGQPMADSEKVKLLLDEDGNFKYSFIGLFFLSLSSKR